MNTNEEQEELERIEKYLMNQLSPEELEQITEQIRVNPDFSKKVQDLQQITRVLRTGYSEGVAKQTLQQLYRQTPVPVRRLRYTVWAGVVSIAASIAILFYFAFSSIQLPVVADDLLTLKGQPPTSSEVSSGSIYTQILAGQKAVQTGNYLLAIDYLKTIPNRTELRSYFREASQWYLVLAYLNSDQARKAERQLRALDELDHPEFAVKKTERWKAYIQIQRKKWL